jgi:hypothetical protein
MDKKPLQGKFIMVLPSAAGIGRLLQKNSYSICKTGYSRVVSWRWHHHFCRAGSGLYNAGSGLAQALYCGLGLLRAWPGFWALGLDCGLSQKTRPMQAQASGLWSKSPSLTCRLGPGPDTALHFWPFWSSCSYKWIPLLVLRFLW